ncbi:VOC family protein [Jatrophihabitans telluris]|uniref:VOC family protein n=1 Tax=Jatrophihabitans telluris TaxID=2038343 RepID=UPI0032219C74
MTTGLQTIVYPVKDLDAAKATFRALFGEPAMDAPYYVGWRVAGQDVGLDPHGHAKGMTGPVGYWQVDDVKARLDELVAAGATVVAEPADVGGGKLIATLTDVDGNVIGLLQP